MSLPNVGIHDVPVHVHVRISFFLVYIQCYACNELYTVPRQLSNMSLFQATLNFCSQNEHRWDHMIYSDNSNWPKQRCALHQ